MRKKFQLINCFISLVVFSQTLLSQTPVLKINDKTDPNVYLERLKIDVKIAGCIAITTMEMVFRNKSASVLAGELVLPLPENISVSKYALDINGKMREAVPVEKIKGTQTFESIERRKVDPGLLEKVEGNNFRTRIYPIPANGSRTIRIGYEQELILSNKNSLRYHLPLNYKRTIDFFKLNISVLQSSFKPGIEEQPADIQFDKWNNIYTASLEKHNFIPERSLTISIPKSTDVPEIMMQKKGEDYYFLINTFPKHVSRKKILPGEITIIWDVSLSSLNRNVSKELDLLDRYIRRKKNLIVSLALLNNSFKKVNEFKIQNGNWTTLKKAIENITYDGGTNLNKIDLNNIYSDEYLLFSDGLSTFGETEFSLNGKPVHTINSSSAADPAALKLIAQKSGGRFINLDELKTGEAINILLEEPFQFIGIKKNDQVNETFPSILTPVITNFSLAGIVTKPQETITLQFGFGNEVVMEKNITLNFTEHTTDSSVNLQRHWAQKKIVELDMQFEKNKDLISSLGKRFSIVTRNTSLIVLETVNDYVQYEIEPPAELREEYDRMIKQRNSNELTRQESLLMETMTSMDALLNWWDKEYKPLITKTELPEKVTTTSLISPIQQQPQPDTAAAIIGFITGKVTDEKGRPIPAVTIYIKGCEQGTTSDANGNFKIGKTSNSPVLVFSTIGMETKEINAGDNSIINAGLDSSNASLQEVIVTGFATTRKRSMTASVSTIQAESLTFSTTLEGKVPGILVTPSDNRIVMRGISSVAAQPIDKKEKPAIILKEWTPNRVYLKEIEKTKPANYYSKYLELRKEYLYTPTFYYDMAVFFFRQKDSVTGLRILSNIAELQFQDHELYKLLGFKLKQTGSYKEALHIFRKVLDWRPQEPQSYRDYGLALADAGYYQQAIDTLYTALTKTYTLDTKDMFDGIEEIIITEINQLIASQKGKPDLSLIDNKLVHSMPVDIRVVLNWNTKDTDIDLWVTDPNGEKSYYSHKETAGGGKFSEDQTEGYGPEQFLLKKAIKGKYKIEVDYYSDTQFKLSGPTTLMVEIFTHYGDDRQQRKLLTLQMDKEEEKEGILVGEFNFQ